MRQIPVMIPKFDDSPSRNGPLSASLEPFPVVQAYSFQGTMRKPVSGHSQVTRPAELNQVQLKLPSGPFR